MQQASSSCCMHTSCATLVVLVLLLALSSGAAAGHGGGSSSNNGGGDDVDDWYAAPPYSSSYDVPGWGSTSGWRARSWRKLLQLEGPLSGTAAAAAPPAAGDPAYNGSALLATYPSLNGSGAGLPRRLPTVYGWVNKSGPAEALAWSQQPHYAIAREAIFLDWRQQELASPAPSLTPGQPLTCSAARHPPAPFHHCHVFVNHAYRVAYIRSPKSASTSIMNWLGQCRYNKTRNWNSTTCMHYTWERYESPDAVAKLWSDYFFFGFVRNPWARAYSLFKDMTGTNHFLHKHGPRCSLPWGRFCRDPFMEFDRLYGAGCSHKPPHYAYWHMMDQYHCMVGQDGGWAVDFLGRVEAGNADWRVVVAEMNRRRLPGVPEVAYTPLDTMHRVEPGERAWERREQQAKKQGQQPAGAPAQQQQQLQGHGHGPQQLQRWQLQQRVQQAQLERGPGRAAVAAASAAASAAAGRRPGEAEGEDEAEEEAPQEQEQQETLLAGHRIVRIFRHLWRRMRSAATLSEGVVAAQQTAGSDAAAVRAGKAPAAQRTEHPYSGENEHCIDAVSQWFACDLERFGYLPQLPEAVPPPAGVTATFADSRAAAEAAAAAAVEAAASAARSAAASAAAARAAPKSVEPTVTVQQ